MSNTPSRRDDENGGDKIGATTVVGRSGRSGRILGHEEGRHLRAVEGSAGYLSLSAKCYTADDCAPGLFAVSIGSISVLGKQKQS